MNHISARIKLESNWDTESFSVILRPPDGQNETDAAQNEIVVEELHNKYSSLLRRFSD